MRASHAWIVLCVCLLTPPVTADEEEDELPPLELLGFIADFSDDEEGWTDPETIEDLFSLNGNKGENDGDSENDEAQVETEIQE